MHGKCSSLTPAHGEPEPCGEGLVHDRYFFMTPPPQSTSAWLLSGRTQKPRTLDHGLQPPSTRMAASAGAGRLTSTRTPVATSKAGTKRSLVK